MLMHGVRYIKKCTSGKMGWDGRSMQNILIV
jgi:hypothetical protein